jgi:hypothetical protein
MKEKVMEAVTYLVAKVFCELLIVDSKEYIILDVHLNSERETLSKPIFMSKSIEEVTAGVLANSLPCLLIHHHPPCYQ